MPLHLPAVHPRPRRTIISFPTNDGLTISYIAAPRSEFREIRSDLDRHFTDSIGSVVDLVERFRQGRRVEPIKGTGSLPNFFRKPYGEGWALVGDAGYHKDPIGAQGISDAFCSAQWLADALHAGFSGLQPLSEALAEYQRAFGMNTSCRCSISTAATRACSRLPKL